MHRIFKPSETTIEKIFCLEKQKTICKLVEQRDVLKACIESSSSVIKWIKKSIKPTQIA